MKSIRSVEKIVTGKPTVDGAGVHLVRVIGYHDVRDFDPFLMLDAFDSTDPEDYIKGFPWHPHRGIETVTYLVEGEIRHGDSLGNEGVIRDGDAQWMTAGSGILHQEMPQPAKRMFGVQLWLNLPAREKMTDPQYGDILANQVPLDRTDGAEVRIVAGPYKGQAGAFEGRHVKAVFLDVSLDADAVWTYDCDPDATLFFYVLQGDGRTGSQGETAVTRRQAVLTGPGEQVHVEAGNEGMRLLLFCAPPLGEPIAWGGPIVMNTEQELAQAFRELDEGTFIRTGATPGS